MLNTFLATFTIDLLRPYLVVESAARGMQARPYFGPFNQLEQLVLDGASPLYSFNPNIVVLATRLEEIAPDLGSRFVTLSPENIDGELKGIEGRLGNLIGQLRQFTEATVLVFNFCEPRHLDAGLADPALPCSQAAVFQRANQLLAKLCGRFPGVHVFDYAHLAHEYGLNSWSDPKLWFLGRIPQGAGGQMATSKRLARYMRAATFPACKCLVLDLDNTLFDREAAFRRVAEAFYREHPSVSASAPMEDVVEKLVVWDKDGYGDRDRMRRRWLAEWPDMGKSPGELERWYRSAMEEAATPDTKVNEFLASLNEEEVPWAS